jgi:hypothetical protein
MASAAVAVPVVNPVPAEILVPQPFKLTRNSTAVEYIALLHAAVSVVCVFRHARREKRERERDRLRLVITGVGQGKELAITVCVAPGLACPGRAIVLPRASTLACLALLLGFSACLPRLSVVSSDSVFALPLHWQE